MVHRLHLLIPPHQLTSNPPTMARNLLLFLLTLLAHSFTATAQSFDSFGELPPLPETETNLHFFWHNKIGPPNPTTVKVAESPTTNKSLTVFGRVNVTDNPLTAGPELSSQLLGKSQGLYISVDQEVVTALMVVSLVFEGGQFNGSTLSVFGRNQELSKERVLPIVGGTGLFLYARGFCTLNTVEYDAEIGYIVVEFHCTARHLYVLRTDQL